MSRASRSAAVLLPVLLLGAAVPGLLSWCSGQVRSPTRAALRRAALCAEGESSGGAGTTALMMAACEGNLEMIKDLAAKGAVIDAQDQYGWTPLRYAVRRGHTDAARGLIELGADFNKPSKSGRTPLMSAAGNGLSNMLELLIKVGADTDAVNNEGETAFQISMRGGVTGCTLCRKMLETGFLQLIATPNAADNEPLAF
mmetsp:Transcript_173278/g.550090  ORF Transcript_173278/g.550090 Transcript_173278/m.550090 type:complete len:199 (-) Transcript_173278:287-883(-)